ncbi:MAG TPA: hypothetical protein VFF06_07810 [Polyangia bacterium]|nr:hypothetical protein [Polyangia bacterium]
MQIRHRATLALGAALLAVVFAVHGPVLAFPYVQEDWEILGVVAHQPFTFAVAHAFRAVHAIHYRPLVATWLIALNQIVGTNGLCSHVLVLLLLAGASLSLALLVERLTGDRVLAALVAVSHAAANVIHIDTLMIQTCGVENLGGTLCFFLGAWLFLKQRPILSASLYAVGLLVKETTIVLPAFVLWCALLVGDEGASPFARARAMLPRMWPHALVLAGYLSIKLRGLSPFTAQPSDPYYMSFFGKHLVTNGMTYLRWSLDALMPSAPPLAAAAIAFVVGAAALAVGRGPNARLRQPRFVLFLLGWFAIGIGPMVVMPNHTYRYYLEFAIPAIWIAWWIALRVIAGRVLGSERRVTLAAAAGVLALCAAAAIDLRQRVAARAELDGSNETLTRATTVARVKSLLERDCGKVPQGGTLLFDDVEVWAFGQEAGPRLWCDNPRMSAFDARHLRVSKSGELAMVDSPTHQGELYTGAHNYAALEAASTFVVHRRDDQLALDPVARWLEER